MNRSQLLRRLEEAWDGLKTSCAGLSTSQMLESGVTGNWSIKDIIAHVTTWEEESLKHLPTIMAGKRTPKYSVAFGGIDAFNAIKTEEKRNLPLTEVLRQRDSAHRRLIEFLQTVPEDQFIRQTRFRRRLKEDAYGHYAKHASAIWKWRQRATSNHA